MRLKVSGYVCPRDHGPLHRHDDMLCCKTCGSSYPVVRGIPIFIVDESSVFAIADYVSATGYLGASYGTATDTTLGVRRLVRRIGHRLAQSPPSLRYLGVAGAITHTRRTQPHPRVLIIGSGGVGYGQPDATVVHTDVAFGPHVDAIADAHNLPFPDGAFDLAVAVAVLEHVADPQRCVAEMWRTLNPNGYIYAATPFLQPVHMGAYDFTRFTPMGHRRLFRHFDALEVGMSMGPGSMLAYALSGFLVSISTRHAWRRMARALALVLTPPLRKLDRWLTSPSACDAAGGMFFFGRRRNDPVPDREIIREYRGGFAKPI